MSLRKQKIETHRTRQRLARWLDHHPQGPTHFSSMLTNMATEIAKKTDAQSSSVGLALTEAPLSIHTIPFLYEESLLHPWNNEGSRPIDVFIAKQARRERPLGRRFLTALAKSTPRIWQIIDVEPGSSLSVRSLSQKPDVEPKIRRVYDELASESLLTGDYIFARVLPMPEGRQFAASILPLTESDAITLSTLPIQAIVQAAFTTWAAAFLREIGGPYTENDLRHAESINLEVEQSESSKPAPASAKPESNNTATHSNNSTADREKLLNRIRKLFAMAQETEASPYEAEIALRRCQKLMERYGIQESDLHSSKFSSESFRTSSRVPMHIKWLATAIEALHDVLFVTGGGYAPEFRGFEIDVKVAKMTMEYLEASTERSLASRRLTGTFPPGRAAAYDYRVSFALEVYRRVFALVAARKKAEDESTSGTALSIRKMDIVRQECTQGLVTGNANYNGARAGLASDAGRTDGSKVSLDSQIGREHQALIETH